MKKWLISSLIISVILAGCAYPPSNGPVGNNSIADAPTAVTMAQGERADACGYTIYLAKLTGAAGTRSDWMHQFEIQRAGGEVVDTLTSWGNEEHELQSQKAQNVRIIVKSIQDTPTLQADVVFDCNR
ncbi:hypothetical protein HYV43_03050 [Candidatus Micrarchaeota archaeon]|nr:hypothetical protein [Candidatus Micrarchaeota archaeon]